MSKPYIVEIRIKGSDQVHLSKPIGRLSTARDMKADYNALADVSAKVIDLVTGEEV